MPACPLDNQQTGFPGKDGGGRNLSGTRFFVLDFGKRFPLHLPAIPLIK
jgi:hypothetical protein